uniref:Uncharacterized protein n=1 Tax=Brassica campestris TaxID=3711 RepID=A0A3P5ZDZ4_BRACM|nr:unnamed protein product [Brassica rapa]
MYSWSFVTTMVEELYRFTGITVMVKPGSWEALKVDLATVIQSISRTMRHWRFKLLSRGGWRPRKIMCCRRMMFSSGYGSRRRMIRWLNGLLR